MQSRRKHRKEGMTTRKKWFLLLLVLEDNPFYKENNLRILFLKPFHNFLWLVRELILRAVASIPSYLKMLFLWLLQLLFFISPSYIYASLSCFSVLIWLKSFFLFGDKLKIHWNWKNQQWENRKKNCKQKH